MRTTAFAAPLLLVALLVIPAGAATAQVATLRTPDPDAAASAPPAEDVDGEEALLAFAACMRDNDIDFPDPQFGVGGGPFASALAAGVDFRSSEFLDATEVCQSFLEALQPEVDSQQRAEQNDQLLAFAECMRGESIDFPDPDPVRGLTIASFRGPDGELTIDPFSSAFLGASVACAGEVGLELPQGS